MGHLEVLKWLKREGCWTEHAASYAAHYGRIEILEWLRSEGEAFDESTCAGAAEEGELETLEWLRGLDPPCPWDKDECRELADDGLFFEVVDYIDEQPNESKEKKRKRH